VRIGSNEGGRGTEKDGRLRRGPVAAMLALLLAAVGAVGCGGTLTAASSPGPVLYGYSAMQVSTVPMGIDAYPSVYWRGAPAYLVEDTWYYQTSGGWVILQEEPRDLYRYRVAARPRATVEYRYSPAYRGRTIQSAPPAYRPPYRGSPVHVQSAPPAYRPPVRSAPPVYQPPVQSAPPAYRPPYRGSPVHVQSAPVRRAPVQVAPPVRRSSPVQSAPPVREHRHR
jgi:hypothetical protein